MDFTENSVLSLANRWERHVTYRGVLLNEHPPRESCPIGSRAYLDGSQPAQNNLSDLRFIFSAQGLGPVCEGQILQQGFEEFNQLTQVMLVVAPEIQPLRVDRAAHLF